MAKPNRPWTFKDIADENRATAMAHGNKAEEVAARIVAFHVAPRGRPQDQQLRAQYLLLAVYAACLDGATLSPNRMRSRVRRLSRQLGATYPGRLDMVAETALADATLEMFNFVTGSWRESY